MCNFTHIDPNELTIITYNLYEILDTFNNQSDNLAVFHFHDFMIHKLWYKYWRAGFGKERLWKRLLMDREYAKDDDETGKLPFVLIKNLAIHIKLVQVGAIQAFCSE